MNNLNDENADVTNSTNNVGENDIPIFTPPEESIPTFTPPEGDNNEIPTFTPPAPGKSNGPKCHNHPTEEAVANCARCGKPICKDCAEACQVDSGTYAGSYLCYDCSKDAIKEDEKKLKSDRFKILVKFILFLGGMGVGFAIGIGEDITMALMLAMIGGSFLSAVKPIASAMGAFFKGFIDLASGENLVGAIINILVGLIKFLGTVIICTIKNIIKMIQYTSYLIRANKAIKETKEALRQLNDFMEYMAMRTSNANMDLNALVGEGGALANNQYARILRDSGEAAADEMLRRATTTIAANGEIIRTYVVE